MPQASERVDAPSMEDAPRRSRTLRAAAVLAAITAIMLSTSAGFAGNIRLTVSTVTPASNATVSNGITWEVSVSNGTPSRVTFAVDGVVSFTDDAAPYIYGGGQGLLDTTTLANGSHQLLATAYPTRGPAGKSSVTVTVANNNPGVAPAPTWSPAITGTTQVGQTLTASSGSWSGTTPMSYAYQWLRCDANGAACAAASGATAATYLLASADAGSTVRVNVSASNTVGTSSTESSPSALVSSPAQTCVSGECMPVGDLTGWKQVFTDDFSTSVPLGGFSNCDAYLHQCSGLPADVRAKWFAYPDGWKDSATGTYMPSKVMSIKDGLMNLYLHSENGVRMVSTPTPIIPGATGSEGGLLYGRYAIRFRADPLVGYKTSFMLWPDSETWPRDGEIDFPEGDLAGTPWSTMYGFVHHQGATSGSDQDWYGSGVAYGNWHTAVVEWLPSRVTFILDGRTIGNTTSGIPNTPMHWVLQTPTTDSILASLSTAGNVQIDWVAAWKQQ
jgi:hypothetical protein